MSVEEPLVPESAWCKSSYSSGEGGQCLEISTHPATVHIRDSKDKTGPVLTLTPTAWTAFLGYAAQAPVTAVAA